MTLPNFATALARFPGLRALAWDRDWLYASRGYRLLRARVQDPAHLKWERVAEYRPSSKRRLSVTNRLTARLFRDGFHALAILPSGGLVAAVPGAIVTLRSRRNRISPDPRHHPRHPPAAHHRRSEQAQSTGENISTTPRAMKSTSTPPPTRRNLERRLHVPQRRHPPRPQHRPRSLGKLPLDSHRRLRR